MNKKPKSIFRMQEAGSVPEVNQYGLTEEQMQSVRDNMRRYGFNEEEAVANKIRSINDAKGMMNAITSNLNGPYWDLYNDAETKANIQRQFGPRINEMSNNLNNTIDALTRDYKEREANKIRQWYNFSSGAQNLLNDVQKTGDETSSYLNWLVNGADKNNVRMSQLHNDLRSKLYERQKAFFDYQQRYLDENPRDIKNEIVYNGENVNPLIPPSFIDREDRAYQYAKNMSGYTPKQYIRDKNGNWTIEEIPSPNEQWKTGAWQGTKIGAGITLSLAALPMFGSEIAASTYGLAGGIPRIIGGFAGSAIGEKGLGFLGKKLDSAFNTKWIEPAARFAGGWIGWGKGANLAYKGALKGTNLAMRTAANNMMRNGAYDVTFQPKRWLIGDQMKADLKLMNAGWDPVKNPISLNKLYDMAGAYRRSNPSMAIATSTHRNGGILKNQFGGLVYKPLVQDTSSLVENPTTISYEPEESNDESFRVEPVRIYNQKTKYKQDAIIEPIQEQDIEPMAENFSTGFTDEEKRVLFNDGTNKEKRKISIKYLQQQLDLTKEQAAAIVGQWQRESHFRLNAENKDEKAGKNSSVKSSQYGIGIGQWTGSRHDAFIKYVNEHGGKANLKTQLDFAVQEIKSNPSFLNNLRKATSVQDASAYTFVQYVGAQYKTIKNIEDLYSKVNNTVAAYRKKHNEMYGRSSNMFDIGLKNAIESLNLS